MSCRSSPYSHRNCCHGCDGATSRLVMSMNECIVVSADKRAVEQSRSALLYLEHEADQSPSDYAPAQLQTRITHCFTMATNLLFPFRFQYRILRSAIMFDASFPFSPLSALCAFQLSPSGSVCIPWKPCKWLISEESTTAKAKTRWEGREDVWRRV